MPNQQGIGIGESDFKVLRLKDYYYIDKTMYIICTLFWIFASAAVIHGQIAMFAK